MAVVRDDRNPYRTFRFVLEIDGVQVAAFQEVSGLDVEHQVIDYREESDAVRTLRKPAGTGKLSSLSCKRGITGDMALLEWCKQASDGRTTSLARRNITIRIMNEKHETVRKWKLGNAWVAKISGPSLNAKGNEVAIETLELGFDGLESE